eukprot:TRINITY_DN3798_c0_g1_i2.p1 TRINITY_DN3798_c0_g1~~TRINITY_DN3798_c0_g1_i2.p1  ORF type:complete len:1071 (+),score=167.45 TRINITY_DN3798_c0_g1_i2:278-3490(+)
MEIVDCGVNFIKSGEKFHGILERAATKGVTRIILIGVDTETSASAMSICENAEYRKYGIKLYFTAGLHPCNANTWGTKTDKDLRKLLKHQACIGVGEVGLSLIDGVKSPREVQRWVFERQVKLAVEFNLPLYLHKRGDVENEVLSIVQKYPLLRDRCLLHCYDGVGDIQPYLDFGFYFGISGTVAMLRGGELRRKITLGQMPLNRMLLETDAPYLLPENWEPIVPGGGSEPCMLPKLASYVETLLAESDCNRNLVKECSNIAIDFFSLDTIKTSKPARSIAIDTQLNPYQQNYSGDSTTGSLRFLVPDNFRRLGRALRGCGIDCEIVRTNEQLKLAEQAREANRILLVRHDRSIRGLANLPQYFKFDDDQIAGQVYQVIHKFGITLTADEIMENRRCTTCNAFSWELGSATSGWKKEVLDPHPHAEVKSNCKCTSCGKIYWPWTRPQLLQFTETFLRFLYQNDSEGDVHTFEDADAYTIIRNCTLQWRATCQFYNGKPGSCKYGMKCPHRHSRHVLGSGRRADLVCVLVHHYRYGLLLSANERQGARWIVPWTFFYDDDAKERAIEMLTTEFGFDINSDEVTEAKSRSDQTLLSSGRRIYFEYHIQDWQQGTRGEDGVRPSETGEDFWLPAIRSFCFQKDLSLAARIVKTCGHGSTAKGDVEGAITLKKYSDADLFSSKNRTPIDLNLSETASLQMKSFHKKNLFILKTQIMANKHNANLYKLREKLCKTQGLKAPSIQRCLWEARKSCFASCPDEAKPKSFKIENQISVDIQTKIIEEHVDRKLSTVQGTQERAELIRQSVHESLVEAYPDIQTIVYGSSSLGICGPFSDVDICLKLPQYATLGISEPASQEDRNDECEALSSFKDTLCTVLMDITPVFKARVPILKCAALPPADIPVDITLRHIGHKNTELLREYFIKYDWIKRLCVIIKDWSSWAGIRTPTEPMLSSYALTIMVVFCFLKKGMLEPGRSPPPQSANQLALFLSYYGWEHNWNKNVICLLDTTLTLTQLSTQTGWDTNPVSGIRDPIELHRNILKPTTKQQLEDIKRRFRLSLEMLCSGKLMDEVDSN